LRARQKLVGKNADHRRLAARFVVGAHCPTHQRMPRVTPALPGRRRPPPPTAPSRSGVPQASKSAAPRPLYAWPC
jgi:hypothetical protein